LYQSTHSTVAISTSGTWWTGWTERARRTWWTGWTERARRTWWTDSGQIVRVGLNRIRRALAVGQPAQVLVDDLDRSPSGPMTVNDSVPLVGNTIRRTA
jgi:hypothetical protein